MSKVKYIFWHITFALARWMMESVYVKEKYISFHYLIKELAGTSCLCLLHSKFVDRWLSVSFDKLCIDKFVCLVVGFDSFQHIQINAQSLIKHKKYNLPATDVSDKLLSYKKI